MKIDVIIPVYRPDKGLFQLIDRLWAQQKEAAGAGRIEIGKIILMNTEKKYFDRLAATDREGYLEKHRELLEVIHLSKREFDHAQTRNEGVKRSKADYFLCMTQDALPFDGKLLKNLAKPLMEDEKIAASYARQLPGKNSSVLERFARYYNYPGQSAVKSEKDKERLGVKTYFFSNVCALYRRDVFECLGGFDAPAIFNEDMVYCAKVLKNGYKVAYAADAGVIHAHNYSCRQQFRRNFDLGVSQSMHPEIFAGIRSEKEGKKMVKAALRWLWKRSETAKIPGFLLQCASKYAGFLLGRNYRRLPRRVILACTLNREFWENI